MNKDAKRNLERAQIRYILDDILSEELDRVDEDLCAGDPQLELTSESLTQMQNKLDEHFTRRKIKFRRLIIVAVAVIASSCIVVGALCSSAIRQLILVNADTHTQITLADYTDADWDDAYIPTVFPGPQSQPSIQITKSQRTLTYQIEAKTLTFYQYKDGTAAGFDSENAEPATPVEIGNYTGWIAQKDGECFLYWSQDGYIFTLLGHFDADQMITTAESIQRRSR